MTAPRPFAEVLAELTRLDAAATPGPWQTSDPKIETRSGWRTEDSFRPGYNAVEVTCEDGAGVVCAAETDKSCTPHQCDAALIAAMRNALPALLARAAVFEAAVAHRKAENEWATTDHEFRSLGYNKMMERIGKASSTLDAAIARALAAENQPRAERGEENNG